MKKFLTLVKRDLTDYRGALVITPLAIALFIFVVAALASLSGKANVVSDGFHIGSNPTGSGLKIEAEDENGHKYKVYKNENGVLVQEKDGVQTPVLNKFSDDERKQASDAIVIGTAFGSSLPIGVAAIAIYFVLAGALYEERKERNIMFWKSLPISDLETVGAKALSTIGGGLGVASLASMALQIGLILLISIFATLVGFDIFNLGQMSIGFLKVWSVILTGLVVAALWAMPVYAWFLAVSAYAPKSPFFAAALPIGILPLIAKIFFEDAVSAMLIPLQHMTAQPVWEQMGNALDFTERNVEKVSLSDVSIAPILQTMASPSFIIGLIVAGGLFYLASEIRRRKAL